MLELRTYRRSDQASIERLHDRARPPWSLDRPPPLPSDLRRIPEHFSAFWVAVDDSDIVGMVGADPSWTDVPAALRADRSVVYLARMRVAPERQRQGIGLRLCEMLLEWALGHGVDAVVTNTTTAQPGAAALYVKAGFLEFTRTPIDDTADHIWFDHPL